MLSSNKYYVVINSLVNNDLYYFFKVTALYKKQSHKLGITDLTKDSLIKLLKLSPTNIKIHYFQ